MTTRAVSPALTAGPQKVDEGQALGRRTFR